MKQFAVIGLGTFGMSVAKELSLQDMQVLAIDKNEQKVQDASSVVTEAVVADATDEKTLKELGISDFDTVIVAIGDDRESSILTTLILKEMGIKNIVVKGLDELHAKLLQKIGADRIVFPERDMGQKIVHSLIYPNIIEKIELSKEYNIAEVCIPKNFIGKNIKELDIRAKYRLHIIGIKRKMPYVKDDGETDFKNQLMIVPSPLESMQEGDVLIVIGKYTDVEGLKNL